MEFYSVNKRLVFAVSNNVIVERHHSSFLNKSRKSPIKRLRTPIVHKIKWKILQSSIYIILIRYFNWLVQRHGGAIYNHSQYIFSERIIFPWRNVAVFILSIQLDFLQFSWYWEEIRNYSKNPKSFFPVIYTIWCVSNYVSFSRI